MNDLQRERLDAQIRQTNERIAEQKRLEHDARLRADSLMFFKDQLEDLRSGLEEDAR